MLSPRIAQHPTLYRIHPVSFRDGNDDVQSELHARALAHQVVSSSQSLLALRRQSMLQQGGLAEISQRHGIECIEALCPGTAARQHGSTARSKRVINGFWRDFPPPFLFAKAGE